MCVSICARLCVSVYSTYLTTLEAQIKTLCALSSAPLAHTHTHTHTHTHLTPRPPLPGSPFWSVYVCVFVSVYVCISVCACVCVSVRVGICAGVLISRKLYAMTICACWSVLCVHTHIQTHSRIHVENMYIHTCIQSYIYK